MLHYGNNHTAVLNKDQLLAIEELLLNNNIPEQCSYFCNNLYRLWLLLQFFSESLFLVYRDLRRYQYLYREFCISTLDGKILLENFEISKKKWVIQSSLQLVFMSFVEIAVACPTFWKETLLTRSRSIATNPITPTIATMCTSFIFIPSFESKEYLRFSEKFRNV